MKNSIDKAIVYLLFIALLFSACAKTDYGNERNNLDKDNTQNAQKNPLSAAALCNGYPELCQKSFADILFAVSHCSYNIGNDSTASQSIPIPNQFARGIRGIMLNIYLDKNSELGNLSPADLVLRNSLESSKQWDLHQELKNIEQFLAANSNEIVVLFISGSSSLELLHAALKEADLLQYLYSHPTGTKWPVLGRMVYNNTRLVIFNTQESEGFAWNHSFENYISESAKELINYQDLGCAEYNTEAKDFFILHHYLQYNSAPLEIEASAYYDKINSSSIIIERLLECTDMNLTKPNFLILKNVEIGNFINAVNTINGV